MAACLRSQAEGNGDLLHQSKEVFQNLAEVAKSMKNLWQEPSQDLMEVLPAHVKSSLANGQTIFCVCKGVQGGICGFGNGGNNGQRERVSG
jgi:hypothetical protein